ncbi:MAG: hypothetical protein MRZ79_08030 [Bacteroidia bacterium]|nr:hypothetical protein [Bacteroidia bacterium]
MGRTYRNILLLSTAIWAIFLIALLKYSSGLMKDYKQDQVLTKKLERLDQADQILSRQHIEIEKIKNLESKFRSRKLSVNKASSFLAYVDSLSQSHSLNILDLPHENKLSVQTYDIYESRIILEGDYKSMVEFIHQMEVIDKVAVLTDFEIKKEKVRVKGKARSLIMAELGLQRLVFNH